MSWVQRLKNALTILTQDRGAAIGVGIFVVLLLMALLAPLLAPHGPFAVIEEDGIWLSNETPSDRFLLGTTNLGRDIYSQLIYGSRSALLVGFSAAVAVAVIGTVIGLLAGYFRGPLDTLLMRLADVAFGIPFLPFVILLAAFMEPSIWNVVFAMALLLWRDTARVIRSQTLVLREQAYVQAARASGAGHFRILLRHIAPGVIPLTFLYGSFAIGWAILAEASISFLGFGDPTTISWGYMLQDAFVSQAMSRGAYYWILPPGILITLAVMAGFFIGRGLEEVLFPQLKRN